MREELIFSTSTELVRVPGEAVVFIAADGNYSALTTADGGRYVLTLQLGQVERLISGMIDGDSNYFIRIGKSLIVNSRYITYINPPRQRLVLSDGRTFRHEVAASKEALRMLKDFIEKEATK